MWLTILLSCGPVGVLLGYIVAAAFISNGHDWRWAFYLQAAVVVPIVLSMLIVPLRYMDLEKDSNKKIRPISAETADPENQNDSEVPRPENG